MAWPTFEKKDDVPEAFRDEYEEKDGKWVVKEPPKPKGEDDPKALKSALQKEREAKEKEEKARKKAEADLKEAETKAREAEDKLEAGKVGLTEDQLADLKKKIRDDERREVQAAMKQKDDEIEGLKGVKDENRDLKLDSKVKTMMAKAGVLANRIEELFILKAGEFDLTEDAKPMLKNHPGTAIDVWLADTVKKEYPEWFEGTKAIGGDAGGHHAGRVPTGITADDVLKDPEGAITTAREKQKAS